jgi:hypothetical protein
MRVFSSVAIAVAACMVLLAAHGGRAVTATRSACWVSGDLVGDSNPIDIQRALCGVALGEQAAVLE